MIRLFIITLLFTFTLLKSYSQANLENIYNAIRNKAKEQQITEQDYPPYLATALKNRGYHVSTIRNEKLLEKYLALDSLLTFKYDSLVKVTNVRIAKYADVGSAKIDEATMNTAMRYRYDLRNRKTELKQKYRVIGYKNTDKEFEADVLSVGDINDTDKIEFIVQTLMAMQAKQRQDSIIESQKELEFNRAIASLPSKTAVKAKFRSYKHRLGYTFELFPAGFTPKANKPVVDRVFGRKARYREVDPNGGNTLIIEYYDSGNILNVTVYKGYEGIYSAAYRDHATKPYEIRATSSDGKFYIVHQRIYDMYNNKTTVKTKYQYVPLDYWYE
ncbi:MAG: hypothetical protein LBF27_08360 [Sphingobacterium sp.]|jgi:hypothetical protein|nr:hypothetical protein [Sphingobacterium sp.]